MLDHIARTPRCAILCHMGGGKSSATLHALNGIGLLDEAPALILGPKRVAVGQDGDRDDNGVWAAEAAKWDSFEHEVVPITGAQTQRIQATQKRALFYATNYEQLPWLVKFWGRNWPYRTIVADEMTKLKGFRTQQGGQRARALGKVAWGGAVERFIELTGTPAPNGVKDLWGPMWFLDRGERLGRSYSAFTARWFRPSWDGFGIEPFDHSQAEIQKLIADLCITIDPRDYGADIALPIETEIMVDLPDKARDTYRDMEKKAYLEIQCALESGKVHEIEAVSAGVKMNKCLQLANGFIYDEEKTAHDVHGAKLAALESIAEEANGMPLLVSTQFKHDQVMIKRAFPKARSIGETTEKEWNAGRVSMMLVHPESAGHGLNLQEGSNILVDFSSSWNLEHDMQVIERIGPMRQFQSGLDRPVYRYRIVAQDTADELVRERRSSKRSVQEILIEAMKRVMS